MRYIVLAVFLLIFGGGGFLLARNGVFAPVELRLEEQGPFVLLYKEHMGPYHKILPLLQEVEKWAADNKVPCALTFGEFLDDPNVVEMERLKSNVGCIVRSGASTVPGNGGASDLPIPELANLPPGLQARELPLHRYIVGYFRGSPALGPYKVYGKADRFRREQNLEATGAVMEIYQVEPNGGIETRFMFPVR